MNAVKATFEKANPGVTIQVKDYSQNFREVIGTQLAGGNAPDVLAITGGGGNNISAKVAGDKGYYADLSGQSWAAMVPATPKEQLSNTKGQLVAVPMTLSSIGGIYNQGAIQAAGLSVPNTWSQVLQFCQEAKAKGKVAYGLGLSDTWTTQMIPYALTASLVYGPDPKFTSEQSKGTKSFSQSAWKTSLDMYMQMKGQGCFNSSPNGTPYSQVQDAIRKGKTLATVSVASETAAIELTGPADLDLTYAAFPATDDASQTYLSTSTVGFGMNAKTQKKALAEKFLSWLATPETQVAYAKAFGDTAAMPGDVKQERQVSTLVQEYVDKDRITVWPDRDWPTTTIQPEVFDGVQALFSGRAHVGDVLKKMDAAFTQS
ncbi:extracellular solute-binding protein [Kineosporia mesophila]|uniref:Extracellular solute-binding protein n=2 Tax=Kineosporia mesophila TaxID=566012 RepID=A0ABP6ZT50_9ACTN